MSRAILAAVVIGGIFAMHGLAVPVAPTMLAAAPAHSASTHAMPGTAPNRIAARGLQAGTASTVVAMASLVAAPMGCGVDHGNCVAVLPSQQQLHAAITVLPTMSPPYLAGPAQLCIDHVSRAPPDISLTRLGISRT